MKTYTDIEQSKKLEEILQVKSADMSWGGTGLGKPFARTIPCKGYPEEICPCWSLAALLEVLPNEISTDEKFVNKYQIDIRKYDGGNNTTWYQIAYGNDRGLSGEWHDMINTGEKDDVIDACVEMIYKLKEKDLL